MFFCVSAIGKIDGADVDIVTKSILPTANLTVSIRATKDETKEDIVQSLLQKLPPKGISYEIQSLTINNPEKNAAIDHIPSELFSICPKVVEFQLNSENLQEIAVNDFKNATELSNLTISQSKHLSKLSAGTLPSKLQRLELKNNVIGTIDDSTFSSLSSLISLDLSSNKLNRINENTFTGLTNVIKLDLQRNEIETIENGGLAHLKNLEILIMDTNKLKVFNSVNGFPALASLRLISLTNNEIEEIDLLGLAKLSNLKSLYVGKNELDFPSSNAISEDLPSNSPLEYIDLRSNNLSSIESLKALRVFPNLQQLFITSNKKLIESGVNTEQVRNFLPKLEHLYTNIYYPGENPGSDLIPHF